MQKTAKILHLDAIYKQTKKTQTEKGVLWEFNYNMFA